MIFNDVNPSVVKAAFETITQVEFARSELQNGHEVKAKFYTPNSGECIAKVERIKNFTAFADSSKNEVSLYLFDFYFEGLQNRNSWTCREFKFNEDQLSRLQNFSLPADGMIGSLVSHEEFGLCLVVAGEGNQITMKSLETGGLYSPRKKSDVKWIANAADVAQAL